jgi:uncharacterized protein (UPF0335 family)
MSDGELRQTMQRLMSIHDEIDEKKLDLKAVYADAKSAGFDKAALGLAIREIRGRAKAETPAAEERAAIVELYVSAFDNAPRTYVHVPAREAATNSKIATPGLSTAVQSEAAAGESPDQGSAASAAGDGAHSSAHADQFVTSPGQGEGAPMPVDPLPAADEPIASARKPYVLRPNCLRPDRCASYGSKHCGECERAAKAQTQEDEEDAGIPAFLRTRPETPEIGEQA